LKIIADTTQFIVEKETAVAIGKFDGVHIGHRKLLQEILEQKKKGLAACVFTFDPPPAVLFGSSDGKELTTKEEKRALFERMGVDILIEFPLTHETAAISPMDFAGRIVAHQMNARFVAAGKDLSFGAKGAGNAELLIAVGKEKGFRVKTIEKVCVDGIEVNSTHIRELLKKGDIQAVNQFLGTPYRVKGTVVHGNRIGRTIGFPTVNLLPAENKLLPPNGVYRSEVLVKGKRYRALSNIGYKPTVTTERVLGVETYLYDFEEEIYDQTIEVCFHEYKRPEQQFESLEALKEQLKRDIQENNY